VRATSLLARLASGPQARLPRRLVNVVLGERLRSVRVLTGVARGRRLELDLSREKAYWIGHYEAPVQEFMRAHVRPGDVVYDVGAHIGFLSLCAASLGARVFAFEASPANAARLRRTAELNRLPIEPVEAAVWDAEEGVALLPGGSASEWRPAPGGPTTGVTLDGFAASHPGPDLLKIDVEGAEARVLNGARSLLADRRPIVLCEIHGSEVREDVLRLLAGYRVEPLHSEWRLVGYPQG
jgi:FkbM family methyltransferase